MEISSSVRIRSPAMAPPVLRLQGVDIEEIGRCADDGDDQDLGYHEKDLHRVPPRTKCLGCSTLPNLR